MKIKSEANQIQLQAKKETIKPSVKTQVVKTDLTMDAGRSSVLGARNFAGETMKFKLQTATTRNGSSAQPTVDPKQEANNILAANGGVKSNENANNAGNAIAQIAKTNPALAVSVMTEVQARLKNTEYGDNVASGFVQNLNDAELKKVADSKDGKPMLQNLQNRLLSGSVHPNERSQAFRIQRQIGETFSETNQGIDPHSDEAFLASSSDALDTNSTPEEAAAGLKTENPIGTDEAANDVYAFTTQLEAHKDDPEWLASYYAALGTEKTTELIGYATNEAGYATGGSSGGTEEAAKQFQNNTEIIRDSFDTLQKSGNLSQSDMNNLVNSMEKGGISQHIAIEIFGKSSNNKVKEMFVRSAIKNGNDTLDAAASHVLSRMPATDQARILSGMDNTTLNNFVVGAMAGEQETFDMKSYLATGNQRQRTTLGGIANILSLATARGGHPSTAGRTAFSPELQVKLFNAATKGLSDPKAFSNMEGNLKFKDGLANIYMSSFDAILKSSYGEGQYTNGIDFEKGKGLENFFRSVVFSNNPSSKAHDVVQFLGSKMKEISTAIENNDQAFLRNLSKDGRTPLSENEAANVMGNLFGLAGAAFKDFADSLPNEAAKRTAWFGFVVDVVSGTVSNAPKNPFVGGLGGAIVSELGGRIHDNLTQAELESLSREFAEKLGVGDPKEFIQKLVAEIRDSFELGNEFAQTFGTVSGIPLN